MSIVDVHESLYLGRAQALVDLGRYEAAIKEAAKGLVSFPESTDLFDLMSVCYLELKALDDADQYNQKSLHINPHNPEAYLIRSVIYHQQFNFDGELEMAKTALKLEPESLDILARVIDAQLQSGFIKDAKLTADRLVKLAPDSYKAHDQLGTICFQLSEWSKAQQHFEAALSINPTEIYLHHNLAMSLSQQKKTIKAIEVLFNALKQAPTNIELQDSIYEAVDKYLPTEMLRSQYEKKLNKLPVSVQNFYLQKRHKLDFSQKYPTLFYSLLWGAVMLTVFIIFSMV